MQLSLLFVFAGCVAVYGLLKLLRKHLFLPRIHQRPVFITGCDSGFGKLLAVDLDVKGVPVYAGCLLERSIKELQNICTSRLKPIKLDVSNEESVRAAAKFVSDDLDGKALWTVVNNAGIPGPSFPFEWTTKQDCRNTIEVNLIGAYDVILKFLPLIRRGKQGRIVNMSSVAGRFAIVTGPYQLSKYGIEALSDGLNFELAPFNISSHVLEPRSFKTSITSPGAQYRGLAACIKQTSEEVKQAYGGEEYLQKHIQARIGTLSATASGKTHLVVVAYEHALFARFPQSRYQVGFGAKYFILPLSLFPVTFQMFVLKVLENHWGETCAPES